MATFKSVEIVRLQAAFATAQRESELLTNTLEIRKKFRAIASMIWDACGEPGTYAKGVGSDLLTRPEIQKTAAKAGY